MANVTNQGSPLKIDTAVASWSAMSLFNNQTLNCLKILWETPTAAGDTAVIKDAFGNTLWTATAEAAVNTAGNSQVFYFQPGELELSKYAGWFVSTLSSGTLFIHYQSL